MRSILNRQVQLIDRHHEPKLIELKVTIQAIYVLQKPLNDEAPEAVPNERDGVVTVQ